MEKFINPNAPYYQLYQTSYSCYLWDMLKPEYPKHINRERYFKKRVDMERQVFFFWDDGYQLLNTLGREAVFETTFKQIYANLEVLPADLHIFDHTLEWTLIRSHEDLTGLGNIG